MHEVHILAYTMALHLQIHVILKPEDNRLTVIWHFEDLRLEAFGGDLNLSGPIRYYKLSISGRKKVCLTLKVFQAGESISRKWKRNAPCPIQTLIYFDVCV